MPAPGRWRQGDRDLWVWGQSRLHSGTLSQNKLVKKIPSKTRHLSQKLRIHSFQSHSPQYLWLTHYQLNLQINFYKKLLVCVRAHVSWHVCRSEDNSGIGSCATSTWFQTKQASQQPQCLILEHFIPINDEREMRLVTKLIFGSISLYCNNFLKIHFMYECSILMYDFMPEESITLEMVVSHYVIAGSWTHALWKSCQCS